MWPLAAIALLTLPAAWLLAHRLSRPTEPRWTEADLPPVGPREGNGWQRVAVAHAAAADQRTLDELLDVDRTLEERVGSFERGAGTLAMDAREHARDVDAAVDAYALPRFADGCVIAIDVSCPSIEIMKAQRLASLRAFALAAEGEWAASLALARALVDAHVDFLQSARSTMSVVVGGMTLERSLIATETLVRLARDAGVDDAVWDESRRGVLRALDRYDRSPLDPGRAVIAEYVFERTALDTVASAGDAPSPWLVDLGATSAWLDARDTELYAYAEGRRATAPHVADPTGGLAWWAYNPGGKLFLAALTSSLEPVIDQARARRDALAVRVTELRATLSSQ